MKTFSRVVLLLLTGWVAAENTFANDEINWLSPAEIKTLEATEPPSPQMGSPADIEDVKADLEAQKNRTPEQIQEAKTDFKVTLDLFARAIGPDFTEKNYPATFDLLNGIKGEVGGIVHDSKHRWKRVRPYDAHPEIKPIFKVEDFSYPSGHSTLSTTWAVLLAMIFPDKAAAVQERARLISESRVIAGVHYPSDIHEGEILGQAIAQAFLAKPEFQANLALAKAEAQAKARK